MSLLFKSQCIYHPKFNHKVGSYESEGKERTTSDSAVHCFGSGKPCYKHTLYYSALLFLFSCRMAIHLRTLEYFKNKMRPFCSWPSFPKPPFLCNCAREINKQTNILYWQRTNHLRNLWLLDRSKIPRNFWWWIKQWQPEKNLSYFPAISLACLLDYNQSRF